MIWDRTPYPDRHDHGANPGPTPLKARAWEMLTATVRDRIEHYTQGRDIRPAAYSLAETITGKPWAMCEAVEHNIIITRLGGGNQ